MAERNTMQKEVIYSALCRMANHPTADDVYELIHEEHPSISRATVFRVLQRLSEKGDVKRVAIAGGSTHFDHQNHIHYHAHCQSCGRVWDVKLPPLQLRTSCADDAGEFEITGYSLQFDGICGECKAKEKAV